MNTVAKLQNETRAHRAAVSLAHHRSVMDAGHLTDEDRLVNFLADLMHWAKARHIDYGKAHEEARDHFDTEVLEEESLEEA